MDCNDQLSIVDTIAVQGDSKDIAYSNNQLIVLHHTPLMIEILHMNGISVKQKMLERKDRLPSQVSVMTEGDVTSIFVFDYGNLGILRLDEDLQEQQVFHIPGATRPPTGGETCIRPFTGRDSFPFTGRDIFPMTVSDICTSEPRCMLAVGENQLLVSDYGHGLWRLDYTIGRWTLLSENVGMAVSNGFGMAFCHEQNVLYYGGRDGVVRYAIS